MTTSTELPVIADLPIELERDVFVRSVIRALAGTLQDVIGLDEASGFISIVGQQIGDQINESYRAALGVPRMTREQVADVLVDLKRRIEGRFYIIEQSDEKIVFGNSACPFAEKVHDRPALCMMTSNVFGVIAADNLGYGKVVLEQTIAQGDPGCRVVVYLAPTPEAEAATGREYYRGRPVSIEDVIPLLDPLPMSILLVSTDGIVRVVNVAAGSQFGLKRGDVVGRSLAALVTDPPQKIAEYLRICARSQRPLPGSLTLSIPEGQTVVCRCEGSRYAPPGWDGPALVLVSIMTHEQATARFHTLNEKIDELNRAIGRRKLVEADLRGQNERLRLMGDVAVELLAQTDVAAMVRSVFDRIRFHFALDGYLSYFIDAEVDERQFLSIEGFPDELGNELLHQLSERADAGIREYAFSSASVDSADSISLALQREGIGSFFSVQLVAGSALLGILAFASRGRASFTESELSFFRTIAHYVTVAYQRLHLINLLREADRRKDDFLATLAHELRNPLATIYSALELMKIAEDDAATVEHARAITNRHLQRMVRMIDELLDISRITRGKVSLRREPVALSAIVASAVESVRPLADEIASRAERHAAGGAGDHRCRRDPDHAGARQPARERGEVHRPWRAHRTGGRA